MQDLRKISILGWLGNANCERLNAYIIDVKSLSRQLFPKAILGRAHRPGDTSWKPLEALEVPFYSNSKLLYAIFYQIVFRVSESFCSTFENLSKFCRSSSLVLSHFYLMLFVCYFGFFRKFFIVIDVNEIPRFFQRIIGSCGNSEVFSDCGEHTPKIFWVRRRNNFRLRNPRLFFNHSSKTMDCLSNHLQKHR